jgi:hypothetical protein
MKLVFAALLIAIGVNLVPSESDSYMVAYLREHSQTPVEFVMAKATSHNNHRRSTLAQAGRGPHNAVDYAPPESRY